MTSPKKYILAAAAAMLCGATALAEAKYVFYFIGDGMGMGHVNAAETYNRDVLRSDTPLLMMTFPVASQARTCSADKPVTDSAAAGTALSTGSKTVNSRIAMAPDSTDLYSVARDFSRAGRAVGVATSVAGDDATPAAFYAHVLERGMKRDIAPQAAGSGVDFLAGGNFKIMSDPEAGEKWLRQMAGEGGYTIVRGIDEYRSKAGDGKVLMMSANPVGDQVGFTIDSIPGAMTLSDITGACIKTLSRRDNGNGFFTMIEGGNIDWAGHANDPGTVIKEILAFQDAIALAYDFYNQHPDETLIVVTADHDTGGLALGRRDADGVDLSVIDSQRMAKDTFADVMRRRMDIGDIPTWEEMQLIMKDKFGLWGALTPTGEQTERLQKTFDDSFVKLNSGSETTMYRTYNDFITTLFDVLSQMSGIGWTSGYHTGNFVPVYAVGEGSELFTGNLDNTEIPILIRKAALGR